MKGKRTTKLFVIAAGVIVTVLVLSLPAMAQCALCKNAVTGSPSAAKLSQSLNFAIIILLIPPVLIFCGIFFAALRQRQPRETTNLAEGARRRSWREKLGLRRKREDRKRRETGGEAA